MSRKRFKPEQIINLLREAEVGLSQGSRARQGLTVAGDLAAELRDERLNGEIFYTVQEIKVLIERWRQHYNTVRPHSSLGYRPPPPDIILPSPAVPAYARLRPAQQGPNQRTILL